MLFIIITSVPADFYPFTKKTPPKEFLKDRCYFQFLLVDDVRQRGQIEGMLGFFLDVRYIHEEH